MKLLKSVILSLLLCSSAFAAPVPASPNAPGAGAPARLDNQSPPTTEQLIAQCQNNTGSPNCAQIVHQGEVTYQARQASLNAPALTPSQQNIAIPDQAGPGSNPTVQPNY